jgi:transglutaminase-like putative cysteine protease
MSESIALSVEHDTHYSYSAPVELAQHLAYLRPLEDEHQRLEVFEMGVDPLPAQHATSRDVFGNSRAFFTVTARHEALHVWAKSRVAVRPRFTALQPDATPPWEAVRDRLRYAAGAPFEPASEFVAPSPYVPRLREVAEYAVESFTPGRPLADAAIELMRRIHADFEYSSEATEVDTPLIEAFTRRRGVCQDFAHVMIGGLRGLGLAARYISGYLLTEPPPGKAKLQGADASHAWVALYCPDSGLPADWLELDPTNDMLPATSHVRLGVGRDYGDVTPLRGVIRGGGDHGLVVRVHTQRVV